MHDGRLAPVTLCLFLVSAIFAVLSFRQISLTYQAADIVYLGRLIENGTEVSQVTVASYAKQTSAIVDRDICRSDVIKSGLSVVLKNLDAQNSESDYEGWATAVQDADSYLTHALSCLPTNGNLWLRLAMVRMTIGEQPDEIARLMTHAQRLAPSELNGVASRLKVWNRLSTETLARASPSVRADLLLAAQRHRSSPDLVVQRPSVALQPYYDEASRLSGSTAGKT